MMPGRSSKCGKELVYSPLSYVASRGVDKKCKQPERLLMRHRLRCARGLYRRDLKEHYGCVNAIEFSHDGGDWISSGGDDRRVLLWNVQKALANIGKPAFMKGEHNSNIFCLAFDNENRKIFSGGNDEQVIVHDISTGDTLDVFTHEDAVYSLTADPNNVSVFASACDDGRILVYDIREPPSSDPFCLANYTSSMHAVMYNPVDPRLLATANAKEGIGLWDIRKPRTCLLRYGGGYVQQSCMSVRFSRSGERLLALRRRLPPVLYSMSSSQPLCEFDHSGYYNSCTMKSCTFAGDNDQYVLSGSDDFNLYMWKVPENLSKRQYINDAHMILEGHRSIVNQVRFNPTNHLIISSGVEKIVKVWSLFEMLDCEGGLGVKKPPPPNIGERSVYTHEEYINLVLQSGHVMTHDYSSHSTEEDPRMMAFFDSLVQRELEGCSSEDDLSSSEQELYDRIIQLSHSDISNGSESESGADVGHSVANNSSDINYEDDSAFSPFSIAFASVVAVQTSRSMEEQSSGISLDTSLDTSANNQNGNVSEGNANSSTTDSSSQQQTSSTGNTRRSISELIVKRKEVKRQASKALRNKQRKRKRPRSSSSESSDGEQSKNSASGSGGNCTGHPENVLSAQKQKAQFQLKRLQQLRNNILKSDSDNSDKEEHSAAATSNKKPNIEQNNSESNAGYAGKDSGGKSCRDEPQGVSKSKATPSKSNEGSELGAYLHETDFSNQPSTSTSMGLMGNSHIHNSCDKISVTVSNSNNENAQCSTSENSGGSHSNFTEFKRFKKRTKASKRQYRQHGSDNEDT
ncbi:DDB1- and CUL4-associated factor 5-like [Mizuhopecten yessoensis]|uniref:DDB1-and CUL4-associated factor 5 n=1 Tax=Mizuhopecten yessoensis TaxID=6573 RepID=A0A210QC21_MIZYE|nr:DDB1- and CUL4-associated factor 5-like [Mizuhopecten yessoensis]OWF46287.1 DDB1- and CUL4-associated factor 5 [Mizuhopecten yessoensis]